MRKSPDFRMRYLLLRMWVACGSQVNIYIFTCEPLHLLFVVYFHMWKHLFVICGSHVTRMRNIPITCEKSYPFTCVNYAFTCVWAFYTCNPHEDRMWKILLRLACDLHVNHMWCELMRTACENVIPPDEVLEDRRWDQQQWCAQSDKDNF